MQSSKLGMLKGYHLSLDGIQKGTLSVKNGIYESKGLDLGPGGWGGGWLLGLFFAGYVPMVSQSSYPIVVYFAAHCRPHLSHFWANM